MLAGTISPQLAALLPSLVLAAAGALFLLGRRLTKATRIWGPLCLLALCAAAWCTVLLSAEAERGRSDTTAPAASSADADSRSPDREERQLAAVRFGGAALVFQWTGLALGLLLTLAAIGKYRTSDSAPRVFGLLLLSVAGIALVAVADDLAVLAVAMELATVPISLLLLPADRESPRRSAAVKHVLLGLLATSLMLYGFALLYGLAGTTNLGAIRDVLAAGSAPGGAADAIGTGSRLGTAALVLIFAGLGFRVAAVPFHFGVPDVSCEATDWNAGVLAVIPRAAAFFVLIRLSGALVGFESPGRTVALVLAGATLTIAALLAPLQTNLRRMLAYATLSHGGFVLLGLAAGFAGLPAAGSQLAGGAGLPDGTAAGLFYLIVSLAATAGVYAILVYLARQGREIEYVEELAGLVRAEPLAAIAGLILLLTWAGLPPLPGFQGRVWVILSAVSMPVDRPGLLIPVPHSSFVIVALIAIANTLAMAAVSLRLIGAIFLDRQIGRPQPSGGGPALAAAVVAALVCVAIGLFPGPVLDYLDAAIW